MPLAVKKCKICRKVGQKMMLNERCLSNKCALQRRKTRPGQHGQRPHNVSAYGRRLLEKQKIKFYYLIKENQLKNYVKKILKGKDPAPVGLVKILERRLDNVVWLAGFAPARTTARQLVSHGHFLVNGRKINLASYLVNPGDRIELKEKSQSSPLFKGLAAKWQKSNQPAWLKIQPNLHQAEVARLAEIEETQLPFDFKLVIDFYTRFSRD